MSPHRWMRNLPPLCNNRAESNRVGRYPYSYHRCSSTGRKTGWFTESCCSYGTYGRSTSRCRDADCYRKGIPRAPRDNRDSGQDRSAALRVSRSYLVLTYRNRIGHRTIPKMGLRNQPHLLKERISDYRIMRERIIYNGRH